MRSQVDRFCSVFFHFWCTEAPFGQMQCCTTNLGKISLKFTDKASIFDDLSVSKTHFTDKPAFPSDLSVNFCPLWRGFTDNAGFLEHLSVKPGAKRLKSYGQTAFFDRFVRNRPFSGRPFTDSMPIFIDVSVNEMQCCASPAQSSCQGRFQIYRQPRFGYSHHCRRLSFIRKTRMILTNHPGF